MGMIKNENKTKPTSTDVMSFLMTVPDEQKRRDSEKLIEIMNKITGHPAVMWGPSIIGFDSYHYKYPTGREGDAPAAGFSPRKANLTIYLMEGFADNSELLTELGPHSTSKSCLYIKRLDDVNINVLKKLIASSYTFIFEQYPKGK